jgi:hypothetical protein
MIKRIAVWDTYVQFWTETVLRDEPKTSRGMIIDFFIHEAEYFDIERRAITVSRSRVLKDMNTISTCLQTPDIFPVCIQYSIILSAIPDTRKFRIVIFGL